MNIGLVTTWHERGAAYVSKAYKNLLEKEHSIFVYARGGNDEKKDILAEEANVTYGWNLFSSNIHKKHLFSWIKKNNIQILFFNEQRDIRIILETKIKFPQIKIGSYVDYYTQETVEDFQYYDFLICNTKRHYSVFKDITKCYYVPWGTDTELYKPARCGNNGEKLVFFHSAGMSTRKGTSVLIETFIEYKMYEKAKLVIHSQIDVGRFTSRSIDELEEKGIEMIVRTVGAPGLYCMGDVYVYPTTLEGLGLTIYEALSAGLPVITTDVAPMNEIINGTNGKLVECEKTYTREDAYYWPLADVSKEALFNAMNYYIQNYENIEREKETAREFACKNLNWSDRRVQVLKIFENASGQDKDYKAALKQEKKRRWNKFLISSFAIMPDILERIILSYINR